jgi:hypothetical protein
MSPAARWLVGFVAPLVAGLPLAFARPFGWLSFWSRVALALPVGWFWTSLVMTAASHLGLRWTMPGMLAAGLAATACASLGLRRERPIPLADAGSGRGYALAAFLLCGAAVVLAVFAVVSGAATSADLIVFWGSKSEAFAASRGIDAAVLAEPALEYLHASYPPLLTNLFALATIHAGRFSWLAATATLPVLLAALALGLTGLLRLGASATRAGVVAAVVVTGLVLLGNEADIAGNAEMPLLLYESLAMALLIAPSADAPSVQRLAGVLLGGAACTKVEGLPFAIAATALFLAMRREHVGGWRAMLRLATPTALGVGLWLAFGVRYRLFLGYRGYGEFHVLFWANVGVVLSGVARSLWLIGYGLPYAAAAALVITRARLPTVAWIPLGTAGALVIFFLFTYLHESDPTRWISWSAARIFSPLVPMLAIGCSTADGPTNDAPLRRGWKKT